MNKNKFLLSGAIALALSLMVLGGVVEIINTIGTVPLNRVAKAARI